MKKHIYWWIAGSSIVAGIAAYSIYKHLQAKEATVESIEEETVGQNYTVPSGLQQMQRASFATINENHSAAAQQMGSIIDDATTNSKKFEEANTQVTNGLNELLK